MTLDLLNSFACALIVLWATWSVLSGKVKDGIIGKLIYSAIAISGYVVMTRDQDIFFGPTSAGLTFHLSLGLAAVRNIFMVIWWRRIRAWLCRHLNCEHCFKPPSNPE
ncbi:hypothetical protein [Pseudomonas typographi]|uniref:Holin n=1 Tax=Pseudomonas typographi TaxID=2715964 RepID=A0ABR7Z9A2_9PSED|nr:hypothetical protein [Pseudomonas typographi]MBD1555025.1 hypothetical protein [Pseudomonas typographi]MBD1601972.1 hypothetical protein [Pseudomonas typographi]